MKLAEIILCENFIEAKEFITYLFERNIKPFMYVFDSPPGHSCEDTISSVKERYNRRNKDPYKYNDSYNYNLNASIISTALGNLVKTEPITSKKELASRVIEAAVLPYQTVIKSFNSIARTMFIDNNTLAISYAKDMTGIKNWDLTNTEHKEILCHYNQSLMRESENNINGYVNELIKFQPNKNTTLKSVLTIILIKVNNEYMFKITGSLGRDKIDGIWDGLYGAENLMYDFNRNLAWGQGLKEYYKFLTKSMATIEGNKIHKITKKERKYPLVLETFEKDVKEENIGITYVSEIFNELDTYFDIIAPKPKEDEKISFSVPRFTIEKEIREHRKKISELHSRKQALLETQAKRAHRRARLDAYNERQVSSRAGVNRRIPRRAA